MMKKQYLIEWKKLKGHVDHYGSSGAININVFVITIIIILLIIPEMILFKRALRVERNTFRIGFIHPVSVF
jgi:hypothetical protein